MSTLDEWSQLSTMLFPAEADDLEVWCRWYRNLGIPAEPDPPGDVVTRTSTTLAAVDMSAPLGKQVRSQLRQMMLQTPVLTHGANAERMVFLVKPTAWPRGHVYDELEASGARLCPQFSRIVLPTSMSGSSVPRWIQEPGRGLVRLTTLVAIIRKLHAARQQLRTR